jgi:hypothetical protein
MPNFQAMVSIGSKVAARAISKSLAMDKLPHGYGFQSLGSNRVFNRDLATHFELPIWSHSSLM